MTGPSPVHLIILIHGLYGSTLNLAAVEQELLALAGSTGSQQGDSADTSNRVEVAKRPPGIPQSAASSSEATDRPKKSLETVVYLPRCIKGARTWDGVDVCAQRIAEEVDKEIERLHEEDKDVTGFSVMGYSMGGLYARYLIGILHARRSFFARHKPVSFSTAATPHLGVLKYGTLANTVVHTVGRQLFSRTGRQIYCLDKEPEWGGRGLLEVMADPGCTFTRALRLFPKVMIVANGCRDATVPYPTASISSHDPFQDTSTLHIEVNDEHIVQSYRHFQVDDPDSLPVNHSTEVDSDGEEVEIKIKVIQSPVNSVAVRGTGGRVRQALPPPFMLFPWPINYIVFAISPLLLPFILLWLATVITIHNVYSKRRIRSHRDAVERQPLLVPSSSSLADSLGISAAMASTDSLINNRPESIAVADSSISRNHGTATPPLAETVNHSSSAPLLLTPAQKLMIRELNAAIPHAERVVSWFPWAYNSHAMLICRDTARFPWQEDGRGVIRKWSRFVHAAGLSVLDMGQSGDTELHGDV
ncbi:hypothetical protein IAU60_001161 [Kwoniella sp. DSM 27419]